MDSLLFYNGKRVFCIFDINHCKNKQPYILSQICTEKEIIYNCTTQNKENILSLIPTDEFYPERKIEMNKNGKNITFKKASYKIENKFWKHISYNDNEHWPRLEPIYQKYCESSSNPDIEEFRKYFIQKVEDKINILKEGQIDIGNDNIGLYIENLTDVFFPNITNSFYMEIEFFDEKYYIVLSYEYKNKRGIYSFTPKTFYTEELYRNRIKIQ